MKSGAFDRAFAKLTGSRKSIHSSVSPHSQAGQGTLLRAYDLLDVTLAHNLPGNVEADDKSVRERCREESDSDLDDLVCPLVILITKLCNADEGARKRMRGWLLPDDLDRTNPLEERSDLLGRCLRLLQSIHHNRLKDATGEMLYAICESDGEIHMFVVVHMDTPANHLIQQHPHYHHMSATGTLLVSCSTRAFSAHHRQLLLVVLRLGHQMPQLTVDPLTRSPVLSKETTLLPK